MSESQVSALRASFNGSLRFETRPDHVSGVVGITALRELDDATGLTTSLASRLEDPRRRGSVRHGCGELLRSRIYAIACGLPWQSAVPGLRRDFAARLAVSSQRGLAPLDSDLASQPTVSRFTCLVAREANRRVLHDGLLLCASQMRRARRKGKLRVVDLDLDSTPISTHGYQEGSAFNGYYREHCYHPGVAILQPYGLFVGLLFRSGKANTAAGFEQRLAEWVNSLRNTVAHKVRVRADAGFVGEELYASLESAETEYAIRLPRYASLRELVEPILARVAKQRLALGEERLFDVSCRLRKWSRTRRVVLVVRRHESAPLYLDWYLIVTNMDPSKYPAEWVLDYYRKRGRMEDQIGELKSALQPHLSCTTRPRSSSARKDSRRARAEGEVMAANEATMLHFMLAYNLVAMLRYLVGDALPGTRGEVARIRRIQDLVLRIAGRLTRQGRRSIVLIPPEAGEILTIAWRAIEAARARLSA